MKYPSMVVALFIGVSSLVTIAADPKYPQSQTNGDSVKGNEANQQQPAAGAADSATSAKQNSPREAPDASAQMKKCDSLQGDDKKNCIAAAKKGQM